MGTWAPGQPVIDIEEDNVNGPVMIIDSDTKGNTGRDLIIFDEEKDDHNDDEIMDDAIQKHVISENDDNNSEIHHTEQTDVSMELETTHEDSTVDVEQDHIYDIDNEHDDNSEHKYMTEYRRTKCCIKKIWTNQKEYDSIYSKLYH